MSPEGIGVVVGVVFTLPTLYALRRTRLESWAWPLLLVSLPVWYAAFGLLAMDVGVMALEILVGLPYIVIGILAWKFKFRFVRYLLGVAWLTHGLYDYFHHDFFINPGVFGWYPSFCAVVDILVGSYLVLTAHE
ncbi:MAG: hypothetical protein L7T24_09000 [Luminiphilus sp.]|nr:hypothetical protein [Luminiphilus sp.]